MSFVFMPSTAIMLPSPTGTAACIALPLSCNKYKASLKSNDSEQTKAQYSPNECPAKNLNALKSKPNSSFKILKLNYFPPIFPGCVFFVNCS